MSVCILNTAAGYLWNLFCMFVSPDSLQDKKKRERTCIHFQAAFLATVMGRFPLKVKGLKVLTSSVWWRTFTKHFLWKCSGNAVSWNNPTFSCFNIWQREDKKVPRGFEQTSKYRWSINVALRQPVSVHERQCVCSLSVLSISYCRLNYAVVAMLPATQLICMCDSISLCVWKAKKKDYFGLYVWFEEALKHFIVQEPNCYRSEASHFHIMWRWRKRRVYNLVSIIQKLRAVERLQSWLWINIHINESRFGAHFWERFGKHLKT